MAEKTILNYQTPDGKVPIRNWLFAGKLNDRTRGIILERLHRLSLGNPGHWQTVGQGVHELKIDFGPGYRIYYALVGKTIILLLCGGDKHSQSKDIIKAHAYWKDYQRRTRL